MSNVSALRRAPLHFSLLAIGVILGVASLIILPCCFLASGPLGVRQGLVAAAICFAIGSAALAATHVAARHRQPLLGLLAAMAIRMVPPLTVCVALAARGGVGPFGPFVGSLLAYYLVTLAADTWLSVAVLNAQPAEGGHA